MANFGVLGTGVVGPTIGRKLIELGHSVMLGARDGANEKATAWAADAGELAHHGTFRNAAQFGEVIVNATAGNGSLAALEAAGTENLAGKVVVDITNLLDFSDGFPPFVGVPSTDSLAEQIQRAHPDARVVKTLNTVTASVMVDPSRAPGEHNVFVSGDDADAKATVTDLLVSFGWPAGRILDLGGIATARASEFYVLLWVQLYGTLGTSEFNIQVHQA
jgi:predicted dinucleotide-binding enzyme